MLQFYRCLDNVSGAIYFQMLPLRAKKIHPQRERDVHCSSAHTEPSTTFYLLRSWNSNSGKGEKGKTRNVSLGEGSTASHNPEMSIEHGQKSINAGTDIVHGKGNIYI